MKMKNLGVGGTPATVYVDLCLFLLVTNILHRLIIIVAANGSDWILAPKLGGF